MPSSPTRPPLRRRLLAAPTLALALAGILATACEPLPPPLCGGSEPTVLGTAGNDTLRGTPGTDVIAGLGGNDTIFGLGGNDQVCAGAGADHVDGGTGNDELDGEGGSDVLNGREGNDVLEDKGTDPAERNRFSGGGGDDILAGGHGRDLAVYTDSLDAGVTVDLGQGGATGQGRDSLRAIDAVVGSPNDDTLVGGDRAEGLDGQGGDDELIGLGGNDNLIGGAGQDVAAHAHAPGPIVADLRTGRIVGHGTDTVTGIEDVLGTRHRDTIAGDAGPNVIDGGDDVDSCTGGGGADTLISCP